MLSEPGHGPAATASAPLAPGPVEAARGAASLAGGTPLVCVPPAGADDAVPADEGSAELRSMLRKSKTDKTTTASPRTIISGRCTPGDRAAEAGRTTGRG